eukprot:CAMPEP_0168517916 /NCGR_PEP_ID=MMETSP0405-20121227/6379_1 /TAXON_ID=498012 /ORGANISM="Trichosphaerium sp, Strain Am-I-7 wt" /LENGTH=83 /DNA_ID=CAMNT_0008538103 /DNA_START=226 /DNA_END=477 /DNA_ORIENTATION=+
MQDQSVAALLQVTKEIKAKKKKAEEKENSEEFISIRQEIFEKTAQIRKMMDKTMEGNKMDRERKRGAKLEKRRMRIQAKRAAR